VSTELKGKVKKKLWLQPPCVVGKGEPVALGRKAHEDFKRDCHGECAFEVASPDVFDEAFELTEPGIG
jgi:hypothetical protein